MKTHFSSRRALVALGFVLVLGAAPARAGTMGLNFCDYWANPQVSDGTADSFANWTDSWLVPEGNFYATGTNASLKGGGPVRVSWQSTNGWSAGSEGNNEQALYREYLDDGTTTTGIGVRISITKLARWLALSENLGYQIRCYSNNDASPNFRPISIRNGANITDPVIQTMTAVALGNGDYPTGGTVGTGVSRGYIDSGTLVADTITLTIPPRSGSTRGTLCAFKITGTGTGLPVDHFESGDGTFNVVNAALGAGLTSVFRAGQDSPSVTGTFTVSATHFIQVIPPTGGFTVTDYTLLALPAGSSPNLADFSLLDLPRGTTGNLRIDTSGANPLLKLAVTAVGSPLPLYWNGNLSGAWDIKNTENWLYASGPSKYWEGDAVVFDNNAVGYTSIILETAVLPASVMVDIDASHPYSISSPGGTGAINGSATLTKTGGGTLTLSTANGYTGATSIQNGVVILGSNTALGSASAGTTVSSGACLDLNGTTQAGEALTIGGSGPTAEGALVNNSSTPASLTASVNLAASTSIGGSGDISLSAITGGARDLVKTGPGMVSSSSAFGITGTFTINQGTWTITGGNTLGTCSETIVNNTGTLSCVGDNKPFGAAPTAANKITINEGGTLSTPDGSCHLGAMVLDGGAITATTARIDWANYNLDQTVSTPGTGRVSTISGGNITVSQTGGTIFNIGAGDTLVVSSRIDGDTSAADAGLIKQGPGTLVLSGTHTYDSATTVNAGVLEVDGTANRTLSLTVGGAGTIAGAGSMAAASTINGTVSPGNLTLPQGTLSLGATNLNGTLAINFDAGTSNKLSVTGALTLGATAAAAFSGAPTASSYDVAACTGTLTGSFTTAAPSGYHWVYDTTGGRIQLVSDSAGYLAWTTAHGLGVHSGLDEDPDQDGLPNGMEYVLGSDPAARETGVTMPSPVYAAGTATCTFDRLVASETADFALALRYGVDLSHWTEISLDTAAPPGVIITRSIDGLSDHIVVSLPADPATQPKFFSSFVFRVQP